MFVETDVYVDSGSVKDKHFRVGDEPGFDFRQKDLEGQKTLAKVGQMRRFAL